MSRSDVDTFTRLVEAVPGLRARVTVDPEGWPLVPARYGRLEWRGVEATGPHEGSARIYAYTDRKRILRRLLAVSGVRPCQSGDDEGSVSMAATDSETIRACAALLHTQIQRKGGPGASPEAMAAVTAARVAAMRAKVGAAPATP